MLSGGFHVSHFAAMVAFAACVSVALAALARGTVAARFKYALFSLVLFLAIGVGIAWLMYPFSR
ncbi:MAG TPA: hypothetical protein VK757_06755 [Candidatus Acidoferrum sp.]|jgi:hypothetical protein|nr:hypothetical protein [Candidatus Acidoferrum sp.]